MTFKNFKFDKGYKVLEMKTPNFMVQKYRKIRGGQ